MSIHKKVFKLATKRVRSPVGHRFLSKFSTTVRRAIKRVTKPFRLKRKKGVRRPRKFFSSRVKPIKRRRSKAITRARRPLTPIRSRLRK